MPDDNPNKKTMDQRAASMRYRLKTQSRLDRIETGELALDNGDLLTELITETIRSMNLPYKEESRLVGRLTSGTSLRRGIEFFQGVTIDAKTRAVLQLGLHAALHSGLLDD